jgi:hypothetical protein
MLDKTCFINAALLVEVKNRSGAQLPEVSCTRKFIKIVTLDNLNPHRLDLRPVLKIHVKITLSSTAMSHKGSYPFAFLTKILYACFMLTTGPTIRRTKSHLLFNNATETQRTAVLLITVTAWCLARVLTSRALGRGLDLCLSHE